MQTTETQTPAATVTTEAAPAKQAAKRQRVAKPEAKQAAKPAKQAAKPATVAKPERAAYDPAARFAAAAAVKAYYGGASLPFKSAADRFADLRTDKPAKRPSQRQAALLATMLAADTAGNVKPDGTFLRGGFRLPRSLFDANAKPGDTVACQPETGCLSDMLGRVVSYVSGPTSGKAQADTVLRLDLEAAEREIGENLGGDLGRAAVARIRALRKAA